MNNPRQIIFAHKWGDEQKYIGLESTDRRYHQFLIGRTGTGKSTVFAKMIEQDIQSGNGFALIDPHGDLSEQVLGFVPKARKKDLVYINPLDLEFPVGLNPLEKTTRENQHLVADNLLSVFRKIWADSWGPRMSYLLHNTLLALLDVPGSTLLSITKMLTDERFRKWIVRQVEDPVVRHYWEVQFPAFPERQIGEITSPVLNKIGAYLTNRRLRNILCQSKNTINFRKVMDENGILIANLSKGLLGEEAANLLGSLIISKIQQTAMARSDIPENDRKDFYLYADEFQNFTTESFADILAEARKYRLNLILANQYLGQLSDNIRDAVLANAGTMIVFRIGVDDAAIMAREFGFDWPVVNLVNLNPYEVFCKIMTGGRVQGPIQAGTLSPSPSPYNEQYIESLKKLSRQKYGRRREKIEHKINASFEKRPDQVSLIKSKGKQQF